MGLELRAADEVEGFDDVVEEPLRLDGPVEKPVAAVKASLLGAGVLDLQPEAHETPVLNWLEGIERQDRLMKTFIAKYVREAFSNIDFQQGFGFDRLDWNVVNDQLFVDLKGIKDEVLRARVARIASERNELFKTVPASKSGQLHLAIDLRDFCAYVEEAMAAVE